MAHGLPVPQGSKRAISSKGRTFLVDDNKDNLKPWRQEIAGLAIEEMQGDGPWSGPVSVRVMFFLPRPRGHFGKGRNEEQLRPSAPIAPHVKPDVDKLARAILDALTGTVFHDDAQVVDLNCSKVYADDWRHPGAMIEVRRVV